MSLNSIWKKAHLYKIQDETYNTRRFFFEFPELDKFDFIPGQFVTMDLPIHEKKNLRLRSYSISSNPDGTNKFELVIVLAKNGLGTDYLFNKVKVGDDILMRAPLGKFLIPTQINHLCFVCTGTGIAPFRSMLKHIKLNNIPHTSIKMIFGTRVESDILYHEEMKQIMNEMPTFEFIPVLSRADENWQGERGYVHNVYEKNYTGNSNVKFMLCGWSAMVEEAKDRLKNMGYGKENVLYELFG